MGALKTYAKAGHVQAARTVGIHTVHYAPSPVTIEALLAKRDLNPARFDLAHKNLGRLLARDERLRASGTSGPYNGLLYPSAYHNYLRWRWSLNPARFEHYHPILGVILAEDHRLQNLPASPMISPSSGEVTPPVVSIPGIPAGTPSGGDGSGGNPPVVPEPGSVVLLVFGASILGISYARRRANPLL